MRRSGANTRQQIVDQALQLFTRKGFHHTSVADLLAATGLTKGGLYGHFASKEEIWEAAYRRAVELWGGIVFAGLDAVDDPLERLGRAIEQDLRGYVGGRVFDGGCFFFNLLVELSGQNQEMADRILRGYDAFADRLARWLEEAKEKKLLKPEADPREIADFLLIVLNGSTALFTARQDPEVLERALRQLRRYLDGWRA
ncbi:MAG: TetR/AcrR family transcriptional regulator [Deltaproteobacteria bacterium]|nr:TetR/AcrR family transcriptional regulator [Deltaproteobacteria bacterium]